MSESVIYRYGINSLAEHYDTAKGELYEKCYWVYRGFLYYHRQKAILSQLHFSDVVILCGRFHLILKLELTAKL